jgi:hypothetical protein
VICVTTLDTVWYRSEHGSYQSIKGTPGAHRMSIAIGVATAILLAYAVYFFTNY